MNNAIEPITKATMHSEFDVNRYRAEFPALHQEISGRPLVYLDNGASTQKPQAVIDAVESFYAHDYANVHRGIHTLSQRATDLFEAARETVRQFINAASLEEVIFTSGTTESINLVAHSFVRANLQPGDEVIVSMMEHHSNIVPWQLLEQQVGLKVRVIPINEHGELLFDEFLKLLSPKTKLLAITQLSNALGTITPLKAMIDAAHDVGAKVLVDGAQAIAHMEVDVQALDCDFYAFSGHKLFSPTGVGVLYGKRALLDAMPPYQGGGEMIKVVSFEGTEFNELPHKFEAGTPNIAGVIGLASGIDYVTQIGLGQIAAYEHALLEYATAKLSAIDGLRIIGTAKDKASILSFQIAGVHASDLGTLLDHQGVAIRVGHHCAMPVMAFFGVDATARASLAFYNTREDIDALVDAIQKAISMLT
ncbi:cysteine desulfurase [Arenicella chitinivorans]|uniref:Cysteine desulfurase n=1 Tax=Arenicella chitinivorans TaxID=1329800 RepID=A0A918S338_9GAMM|nr:cysteine desulfurase [Arenicella chitinivorans]GHA18420.1 cysteine desulfurase [Arenicella chitinivorans]